MIFIWKKIQKRQTSFLQKNTSQKPGSFREDFKDYSSVSFCINLEFFMWKWVFSADFHRLEYFQDFGDGKLLVGQSNEISEIWKNALEEDPEHPSLPQDDWWLLIKLCFFPFIAFRPKVANYCLVYYKDDHFYCDFLIKIINMYLILRWRIPLFWTFMK